MFSHDVLVTVKAYLDNLAIKHNYISFVNHLSDLYQIEASFVYNPATLTFNILLHVPFVKPEYLLQLNQYVPFPLSQQMSVNHSLTPAVGDKDILAYGNMNTFKILSQSDLASCHKMGDTYFCKGRNVLQTKLEDTCLGAIFVRHLSGMKTFCKFEVKPLKEQVFQISRNKWQIFSYQQFTTTIVCEKSVKPLSIGYSVTLELQPGCKVRLQAHLLYAEQEETITLEPMHYTWTWNASTLFPEISADQFSTALQSLHEYGLHVVEASDIAHHLKFANFNVDTPDQITALFTNPFNYMSIFLTLIAISLAAYFTYKCFCQPAPPPPYPPSAPIINCHQPHSSFYPQA